MWLLMSEWKSRGGQLFLWNIYSQLDSVCTFNIALIGYLLYKWHFLADRDKGTNNNYNQKGVSLSLLQVAKVACANK